MNGPAFTRPGLIQHITSNLLTAPNLKSELQKLKNGQNVIYTIEDLAISNSLANSNEFNILINRVTSHNNNDDGTGIQGTFRVEGGLASILNGTKAKDVVDKIQVRTLIYIGDFTPVGDGMPTSGMPASGGRRRKYTKKARKTRRRSRKHRS